MSTNKRFTLFDGHLDRAHQLWRTLLQPGKLAVDATCGNGHDTLVLAKTGADVLACDIQPAAVAQTQVRLAAYPQVTLVECSHTELIDYLGEQPITLLVYNLGYLPGSDKQLTTQVSTTLHSVQTLLPYLESGGAISITCYPGHAEGAREERALLDWAVTLAPNEWSCCHYRWLNRQRSPSLLLLQRATV